MQYIKCNGNNVDQLGIFGPFSMIYQNTESGFYGIDKNGVCVDIAEYEVEFDHTANWIMVSGEHKGQIMDGFVIFDEKHLPIMK